MSKLIMFATVALFLCAGGSRAAMYSGILTYSPPEPADANDGIFVLPSGGWWVDSNITMSWTVTDQGSPDANYPWKYTYTFSTDGPHGAVSHFILEASVGIAADDIMGLTGASLDSAGLQKTSAGNPGMPEDMNGLRFFPLSEDVRTLSWSFYCNRQPVWGDFLAKDGGTLEQKNVAFNYNSGGGTPQGFVSPDGDESIMDDVDPNVPPQDGSVDFHILVPDSKIPEPMTVVLLGVGAVFAIMRRRRRVGAAGR